MSVAAAIDGKLFIGGEWRDGTARIDVVNPATEETIGTVVAATARDIDDAVVSARAALRGPWAALNARDRGRLLSKLAQRILERADEFARLETLHNGKPIFESRCYACHGPEKQKNGLRLDRAKDALAGGDTGAAIVPGKPADYLYRQLLNFREGRRAFMEKRKPQFKGK